MNVMNGKHPRPHKSCRSGWTFELHERKYGRNSAELLLLTPSKICGSLFSSQFNVICPDTWHKWRCRASKGVWVPRAPVMDLHVFLFLPPLPTPLVTHLQPAIFSTLISAVWPSSDEVCLTRRLKVIGWISDADISLSSDITEAASEAAGTGGIRPYPRQQLSQTRRDRGSHLKHKTQLDFYTFLSFTSIFFLSI